MSIRDNVSANNLYDALNSSVYYSRDDAARVYRGGLIIDKSKLNSHFGQEHIKSFGNHRLSRSDYKISYLPDDSSQGRQLSKGDREAVKAVRVIVNYHIGNNHEGKKDNHIATVVSHVSDNPNAAKPSRPIQNDLTMNNK